MTVEEAKNIVEGITDKIETTTNIDKWAKFWGFTRESYEEFLEIALKAVEQEPKYISEIPKDYEYDTETEDFLVYRHKYTGDEIHITKPLPVYTLSKESDEIMNSILDIKKEMASETFSDVYKIICKMADYTDTLEQRIDELENKMELINTRSNLLASDEERYYG